MLRDWVLSKLEAIQESPRVLLRDPLRLLPEVDGVIHSFACEHAYTVIVASTNLAFRELYERAIADPETRKLLVIDRAPARRRASPSAMKAPPPFYPDLLADTPKEARIDLDLRQFLKEITGDPNWPFEASDPRYARLIVRHLDGVFRAHRNLRTAHEGRFTDHDFKTLVAFAALGVADAAFKRLDARDYWKIGLLGHEALEELDSLAPEVTRPLREELLKAPAPFCWFADRDPETVLRAFYLSVILSQHLENWNLLLANLDPALAPLAHIQAAVLGESAPKLVTLDPGQADRDLEAVERALDRDALQFLLLAQMKITEPTGFVAAIEKERYSTLIRSLALLLALDDLLSGQPARDEQARIAGILFPEGDVGGAGFVDARPSIPWSHLKEAYGLARDIQALRDDLAHGIKTLKVMKTVQLTFQRFRELWNEKRINRLEYYLSALERLAFNSDLLPRAEEELPSVFGNALDQIRQGIRSITEDVYRQLEEVNRRFQEMMATQYPLWVEGNGKVKVKSEKVKSGKASVEPASHVPLLPCHFLRHCLKPHWDPPNEKAVIFIFDGMRYDIWDELLRPMLADRMELVEELPAASLLPSETRLARKAISAGAYPDAFDISSGEDRLLQDALAREFHYTGDVEVITPEGTGTGETVRYRAGNLDVYIFELCDKELHKISLKVLPDGREVPARPLAFIYQQHLKNIIDTEVMAIVRGLAPGTKVFVTADHGFGRVGRQPLWFDERDMNERDDCSYLNCWLRVPVEQANLPAKVRQNILAFTPEQLRMPKEESRTLQKTGQVFHKEYQAIVFPKAGYSFSRQGSHYNPDAYSHGGISIQELMIPMVVLRVKPREEGLLMLDTIHGPREAVEGEEIEFRMRLSRGARGSAGMEELRVDVEAIYSHDPDRSSLPRQVLYVPIQGAEVIYRFRPDPADAREEERLQGMMERVLTIAVSYREGRRIFRKSQTHRFSVQLNSEQVIRRVPAHLGNILGLTPKSMR